MGGDADKHIKVDWSDTRSTEYKYGVGYAWSENLQIDINAFLEGGEDQDVWDLATYRELAVSAALIF